MSEGRGLDRIQHWMQAVITDPAGVRVGLASEKATRQISASPDRIDDVVARRGALTGTQALEIYSRGYQARLLGCFRAEFPILLYALGDDLFEQFALDYLQRHPSRTHSLIHLCREFPRHLAETRPDAESAPGSRERWPDFIVDLATLERSFNEVFHGPGSEADELPSGGRVRTLSAAQLQASRVKTVVCLRLHHFRFPVVDYFDAVRAQRNPELPEPIENHASLHRRDYTVRMTSTSHLQFALLSKLLEGATVAQASQAAAAATGRDTLDVESELRPWLIAWADHGLLASIGYPATILAPR